MKVYSDILTEQDLRVALAEAVNTCTPGHCGFERLAPLPRPRLRSRGWDVLLHRAGGRPFNTGKRGSEYSERTGAGAASWDDYGRWLAALYELDPAMRAGYYLSRENFHLSTDGKYRPVTA
jgi:hypothetical protein